MIESGGAQYVGDYRPLSSGNSVGGKCPQPFGEMLELSGEDTVLEVFVNTQAGFFGFRVKDHDGEDIDEFLE